MLNKILIAALLSLATIGCVAPNGQTSQITLDDVMSFTSDKIAEVTTAINTTAGKVSELDAKIQEANATISSVESVVGPADTDGDGTISTKEAEDFFGRVATNPNTQDEETQAKVYKALMGLLGAQFVSRQLGHKLPPQLQWLTSFLGSPVDKSKNKAS